MANYHLHETPTLGFAPIESAGIMLAEELGLALVAVTIRTGKDRAFANAFKKFYGCPPPSPQRALVAKNCYCIAAALSQVFITAKVSPENLVQLLEGQFDKAATITDQSDGWVRLILTGINAQSVLERITAIDTRPTVFTVGSVARTAVEHCGVILIRHKSKSGEGLRYSILTPRSSAQDLWRIIAEAMDFK